MSKELTTWHAGDAWEHWAAAGMPEFIQLNLKPFHTLRVLLTKQPPPACKKSDPAFKPFVNISFKKEDLDRLSEVSDKLGVEISLGTKEVTLDTTEHGLSALLFGDENKIKHHSTWYPFLPETHHREDVYRQADGVAPEPPISPIYIISKDRWKQPLTARELERMGVFYTLVCEPKEYDQYKKTFAGMYDDGYGGTKPYTHGTLHVAPENFSERGNGSIPIRNYCWDLAIKASGKSGRHFLMDDNIPTFLRLHHNLHTPVETPEIFRAAEVFVDRFENIAIAGFQNNQYAMAKHNWAPFALNTRAFSCTLIRNDLRLTDGLSPEEIAESKGRWRGRYSEDLDLCIRALKSGWVVLKFVAFNSDKVGTMTMKGGNTDELYAGDPTQKGSGRYKMVVLLRDQHPDVVRLCYDGRYNRWQAKVDFLKCVKIGKKAKVGGCVLKLKEGAQGWGRKEWELKSVELRRGRQSICKRHMKTRHIAVPVDTQRWAEPTLCPQNL